MEDENVTFGGTEASIINLDMIVNAIASIPKMKEPIISRITHNCTDKEFMDLFQIEEETKSAVAPWFGISVYK